MSINNVIYQPNGCDFHSDSRRDLLAPFNSDLNDFSPMQVKALRINQDCILGGHYHKYNEMYGAFGEILFLLEDIHTKVREAYILGEKSRLLIPSEVAHIAFAKKKSILIGITDEAYTQDRADISYDIDVKNYEDALQLLKK
jgi:hypothetical protein